MIEQLKTDLSLSVLRNEDGKTKEILAELDRLTKEKEQSDEKVKRLIEKKAGKDSEIQTVLQKVKHCEERVANAGGGFYEKRESLKGKKSELSVELGSVEKEISELCANILPFSMVPNQLQEINKKIVEDKKIFQQSFEKDILEENFDAILKEMKSKNIAKDITEDMTMIFESRLEKTVGETETTFNLSNEDMQNVTNFINTIDKSNDKKLLGLIKNFGHITDLLEKVQVGLESVPKDDDVGPIISELQKEKS